MGVEPFRAPGLEFVNVALTDPERCGESALRPAVLFPDATNEPPEVASPGPRSMIAGAKRVETRPRYPRFMPIQLLTVCTGNIVRSPLSELYLRLLLADLPVEVASAGTHPRPGEAMTDQACEIASELGIPAAEIEAHQAQRLTEPLVAGRDLVLAMTRAHRKTVVELDPTLLRKTFTVLEFARLSRHVTDAELRDAATDAGDDDRARFEAALARVLAVRGTVDAPGDPAEDDVLDPAGRSWNTYETSMSQLLPAVEEVARVIRAALTPDV